MIGKSEDEEGRGRTRLGNDGDALAEADRSGANLSEPTGAADDGHLRRAGDGVADDDTWTIAR